MTPAIFSSLALAWGAFAIAALSPGPNMIIVASRALGVGLSSAIMVVVGISIGAFLWAMLASMSLAAIFKAYPFVIGIFGIIGGGYLVFLGLKGLRSVFYGSSSTILPNNKPVSSLQNLRLGLMVTATNPKVALLWVSLSTMVSSTATSYEISILFATGAAMLAFLIYGFYAFIFSLNKFQRLHQKFEPIFDGIFGLTFLLIGIGLFRYALLAN